MRSILGAEADWGSVEHLTAAVIDLLRVGNWQRAGNKRAPRPKPIPRPGEGRPGEERIGGDAMTPEELNKRLAMAGGE